MSIWKSFKELLTGVESVEVISESPQKYNIFVGTAFRKGMWVQTDNGRIGVISTINPDGTYSVNLTNAAGQNIMEPDLENHTFVPSIVTKSEVLLKRAKISDIPTKRYDTIDQLYDLGYED